jgi:hypothetical protein
MGLGSRVKGQGSSVKGQESRVKGQGFWTLGVKFRVLGSGSTCYGVQGSEFRLADYFLNSGLNPKTPFRNTPNPKLLNP